MASSYALQAQAILLLEGDDFQDSYSEFRRKYKNDLSGFVHDCIMWDKKQGAAEYQKEIMTELVNKRRASLRGPHGLGKTAMAAWVVLWFALTRDGDVDWKIPTTASAWRQLSKFLWPEIHKWSRRLNWGAIGREPFTKWELTLQSIRLKTGEAFAMASDNHELIEGAHATELLYLFDESKAIPDATWDAAEGAMSVGNTYWLAISTPGEPMGRFYDIHRKAPGFEDWYAKHVTRDEVIHAGRMAKAWAKQREKQWGAESAVYKNRVLGEFAANDVDGVVPLSAVERANERWQAIHETGDWGELTVIGADIGRGGDDSVLAMRHADAIHELRRFNERNIMPVTGRIAGILTGNKFAKAIIDVIGIGAGVVDRLREMEGLRGRVMAFSAASKTTMLDQSKEVGFANVRSAAWWAVREMLLADEIALPPDDLLTGDLTSPRYKMMSGGKIQVEAKEEVKKRLGRSTDSADAVCMAYFAENLSSDASDLDGLGKIEDYSSRWE